MQYPLQMAFLETLGWTILNSWWQFGLLWLILLFLKKVLPKGSATIRYNSSVYLLFIGLGWILISFLLRYYSLLNNGYQLITITDNQLYTWHWRLHPYLLLALPYISVTYLFWLGFKLIKFSKSLICSQHLVRSGDGKAPARWRVFVQEMAARMNIKGPVQVWISKKIDTPMIIGWLKPVILLPAAAICQLNPDQMETILIHELAHIRRNDYFWNILVSLAEQFLFYNPFARLIIQDIRAEREHACDDWVLQFPYQPARYAQALLQLEHLRIGHQSAILLAARGNNRQMLLYRVQRMLNLPTNKPVNQARFTAMLIFALLLCLTGLFEPRREIMQKIELAINSPVLNRKIIDREAAKTIVGKESNSEKAVIGKSVQLVNQKQDPGKGKVAGPEVEIPAQLLQLASSGDYAFPDDSNERGFPAIVTEERAYSLHDDNRPEPVFQGSLNDNLPYIPQSSFQAIIQRDSLIPEAILAEKLADLQEKEANLHRKLALIQENWGSLAQQKIAGIELEEALNAKKAELEILQHQVEQQTMRFNLIIEKQEKSRQEQNRKSLRIRKIVHI